MDFYDFLKDIPDFVPCEPCKKDRAMNEDEVYESLKDYFDTKEEALNALDSFIEYETTGCSAEGIDGDLCLVYLNENNDRLAYTAVLPDIVNVSSPNDKIVFVEFADGTKEIAKRNDEDMFNLETGILICIIKRMFSDMNLMVSGSSAYNKVIKYALSKVDYTKKKRQEERDLTKKIQKENSFRTEKIRSLAQKDREKRIDEMAEAYKRAIKDLTEEGKDEVEKNIQELIDILKLSEENNE